MRGEVTNLRKKRFVGEFSAVEDDSIPRLGTVGEFLEGPRVALLPQSARFQAGTPAISSRIARAAARGAGAAQTGRPTTMWSAPAAMALRGVAMRF